MCGRGRAIHWRGGLVPLQVPVTLPPLPIVSPAHLPGLISPTLISPTLISPSPSPPPLSPPPHLPALIFPVLIPLPLSPPFSSLHPRPLPHFSALIPSLESPPLAFLLHSPILHPLRKNIMLDNASTSKYLNSIINIFWRVRAYHDLCRGRKT